MIDSALHAVCWGRTIFNSLAVEESDARRVLCATNDVASCFDLLEIEMPAGFTTFDSLSTKDTASCAISTDQRVVCWGGNEFFNTEPVEIVLAP